MKVAPLIAAFVFALASQAAAAADLSDPVPGHPGLTQFDLLKLVVTDLARGGDGSASGTKTVPFVHIEGKDSRIDLPDDLTVVSIEVMPVPGDPSREIMLADFGPSEGFVANAELMALFSLDPKPRLLDVTEVGSDRFVALETPIKLLAPDAPLLVIESEHDNSNEAYLSSAMVTVRADKFRWIDSVFTFNVSLCSFQDFQQPTFTPRPAKGSAYASIDVRVVEETKLTGEDGCNDELKPPKPGKRVYATTYRWSSAKQDFQPTNTVLERLMQETTKRF